MTNNTTVILEKLDLEPWSTEIIPVKLQRSQQLKIIQELQQTIQLIFSKLGGIQQYLADKKLFTLSPMELMQNPMPILAQNSLKH